MFNLFGSDGDNALNLLKNDHEEVSRLFDEYEDRKDDADAATKIEIAESICLALVVHAQIEEELFYPAVRKADDAGDLLDEAIVEHQTLKDLIAQLQDETPGEALYDAKVKVLGEYVQHHVGEEEKEIFAKAKSADIDLDALGLKMKARKEELMQGPLPLPMATRTQRPSSARQPSRKQAKRATSSKRTTATSTKRSSTSSRKTGPKNSRSAARSR